MFPPIVGIFIGIELKASQAENKNKQLCFHQEQRCFGLNAKEDQKE